MSNNVSEDGFCKSDQIADRKSLEVDLAWNLHEETFQYILKKRMEWRDRRYIEQNYRCIYCRQILLKGDQSSKHDNLLTVDHVVPLAKGGADTFENTVAACHACNVAKGMMDVQEFASHSIRLQRFASANTPPERLSVDESSDYYSPFDLDRGIRVFFKGFERFDVHEYDTLEGWIKVPVGKSKNRNGKPLLIKLSGPTRVAYQNALEDMIR